MFDWRKASNCKRLLRNVQCRLVLLKNKRCSIVRQRRLDVAELLKLGHAHKSPSPGDCPNDINEAISSLIFASARCCDIPELRSVRKLLAERYGQKYVMSALELLPGNLVNCQIRNNLSIRTVAEDVKIKLVNEIFRDCNLLYGSSELRLPLNTTPNVDANPLMK